MNNVKDILKRKYSKHPSLQNKLFFLARDTKNLQEMNDYIVYLNSKDIAIKNMIAVINPILETVAKENRYKISNIKTDLDHRQRIYMKYTLVNDLGDDFDIEINDILAIDWKYGDYKGHCCEKTTNLIFKAIEQKGIEIKDKKITRNHNAQRSTYKAKEKIKYIGDN
ncbi:hypothetical protein KQ878_02265 [Mycoplasma zalophidermidis]|uniref:Uncharacterized protein n=1 Tax=Mycoplasma zalophidermidis TaxID=398174 RepID=A0ABS6DS23_9MOLU|nr:hypothetical protein [Mycoplasma zalophidermidis]MBU4693697.1 hypothetical protein [Mycoplasma zalophidermidis]